MSYIIKGNLQGMLCSDCSQSVSGGSVKVYKPQDLKAETVMVAAATKETFHQVDSGELKTKQKQLLGEAALQENGDFTLTIDGGSDYNGGAIEIDWYCGSVPVKIGPKPRKELSLQFSITTLQPHWKEYADGNDQQNFQYGWDYIIPSQWFCRILSLYGLYVICGQVVNCKDKVPVSDVRVFAFDVDLIQDDPLGSAVSDVTGHFTLWYTEADFSKTIFSWLNVEWPAGPDLYFRVETLTGNVLLQEPRSDGHKPGRENASNCFCVSLCVGFTNPPSRPIPIPAFIQVGGYEYDTQINSAVLGNGLTTSGNYAFFNTLRLNGILAQTFGGQPMEYCFEYTDHYDGSGQPANWKRVLANQIAGTKIGYLEKATLVTLPSPHYEYNNVGYYVSNVPVAGSLTTPIAVDGWILVPQENDDPTNSAGSGLFVSNGNQINLISQTLAAFAPIDLAGLQAGNSATSTGKSLAQDQVFALRMLVRQQGNNSTVTEAGVCKRIAIDNTLYNNLNHHPEWGGNMENNAYGVCMVDILQLQAAGCSKITSQVDILYTVSHPNVGSIGLTLTGPGGTQNLGPVAASSDAAGTVTHFFAVTDPLCAYLVTLTATFLLTTGDSTLNSYYDQIAFCR